VILWLAIRARGPYDYPSCTHVKRVLLRSHLLSVFKEPAFNRAATKEPSMAIEGGPHFARLGNVR